MRNSTSLQGITGSVLALDIVELVRLMLTVDSDSEVIVPVLPAVLAESSEFDLNGFVLWSVFPLRVRFGSDKPPIGSDLAVIVWLELLDEADEQEADEPDGQAPGGDTTEEEEAEEGGD